MDLHYRLRFFPLNLRNAIFIRDVDAINATSNKSMLQRASLALGVNYAEADTKPIIAGRIVEVLDGGPAAFEAAVPYAVIQQALMAQYNLNVINNLQHGPPINQVNAEEGPNAPPPPVIRHRWNRTKKACFLSALIGVALILLSLISHAASTPKQVIIGLNDKYINCSSENFMDCTSEIKIEEMCRRNLTNTDQESSTQLLRECRQPIEKLCDLRAHEDCKHLQVVDEPPVAILANTQIWFVWYFFILVGCLTFIKMVRDTIFLED